MKYLELPDDLVRDATGQTWVACEGADEIWVPVRGRLVELPRTDPVTEVIVSREALAVVLNYAHFIGASNPDTQLRQAMLDLDRSMRS